MEEKNEVLEKTRVPLKSLFWTFFKIGFITFGGGYAMISNIKEELIDKKNWLKEDEMVKIIAISESTPGPIAINMATFIGYNKGGIKGSILATLGVALPSLITLYIISLFFNQFMEIKLIQNAFVGIKVGVGILIVRAGYNMFKKLPKKPFELIIFSITMILMILFDIISFNFSSIIYIFVSALLGILFFSLKKGDKKI